LLAIWMAYRYVPSTAPGGVQPDSDGDALDWRGLALASTSTLALLNGLVHLHEGVSVASVGLLGFALACLLLFVFWQKRLAARGEVGLMNLALFDVRSFAMGSLVSAIYGAALFGSTYLLPVYMQSALKLAPSLVGAILLPAGLVLAVVIAIVGRLADKVPGYLLVTVGLALLASSFVSMDLVEPLSPLWLLVALSILGRVGLGFILPSLNIGAMRGLPKPMIAQGASVINFVRTLGGAAGVSLCGIALEWRLQVHGDRLSNPVTTQARLDAFGEVFWMLGLTCALAILASWKLREPS
jgi:predicted MFS family arabinose efflux permease